MLDDADLAEGTLSDASEENEVKEVNVSIEVDDLRTAADGAH
jgi:hypothetical protein